MDTKDTISVLNDLIETSKDGEKGFMECAEELARSAAQEHHEPARPRLRHGRGGTAADGALAGRRPGNLHQHGGRDHRRWVDLKSMITGKDYEAILNECERGEDVAVKSYRKALEKDLPAEVRLVVERQYQGVLRNHDQVKALRDAARARS
ncbi:Aldehyde dehydrogenase OS=Stutzerimonas stutzeri OX=316 GN=CXK95_11620 PE=4 SV=1 [Stutzerimonas stutzeri]